jgi:uncharacterized protein (DUF2141 family)
MFRFVFAFLLTVSAARPGVLHVDVMNLRNDHGAVHCELFQSAKGFPKRADKAAAALKAEINEKSAVCEFRNLPPGRRRRCQVSGTGNSGDS